MQEGINMADYNIDEIYTVDEALEKIQEKLDMMDDIKWDVEELIEKVREIHEDETNMDDEDDEELSCGCEGECECDDDDDFEYDVTDEIEDAEYNDETK
tara:strand:+ start:36636 stop:36932 length:297 start_codon:yes stop_codon:yes gene_type:complete